MNDPTAILERSLRRDASIRAAGNVPGPVSESQIIDFIVKHRLYDNETARRWLVARASTQNYRVRDRIVESIGPFSERGHVRDAVAMFSSVVGLEDEGESSQQRQEVFHMQSMTSHKLKKLLETPGLVSSHPSIWGKCLVHLQSLLLLEEQLERRGKMPASPKTMKPDYNGYFHDRYYLRKRPEYAAWSMVTHAIEQGLTEAVALSEKRPFYILADQLVSSEWGLAICQPLVALYDQVRTETERSWQHSEATRLLCAVKVEECYAAFAWRRLLREQLLPVLQEEDQKRLLKRIRESQGNDRVRVRELVDFDKYVVLTQKEKHEIDKARRDGELFGPRDPRELRNIGESSAFSRETPTDRFMKTWPHPEDHASLRLLADTERISGKATIDEVEASLFPRLDALNAVTKRLEIDSPDWIGEILGWCACTIGDMKQWYRIKHEIPKNVEINVDQYLESLEEKTSWWENRVAAALERLKQPPPESHNSHESHQIWWGSNDPIACSLGYLDEILAVPAGSRLDAYRSDLANTIVQVWDAWPSYTRGLAITILRAYHWATNENLNKRLMCMLRTATHSQEIEFSLHHLLRLEQSGITDLMRLLIDRVDTLTSPSDIAHLIGSVIGDAVARYRGDGEDTQELANLSQLYDDLTADRSQGQSVRYSLIASIIQGARSHLSSLDRLKCAHAQLWLSIITWGLTDWLEMSTERNDDLPVLPITAVLEMKWDDNQRIFLLEGMADIMIRIINEADLDGFYEIHYDLRKLLKVEKAEQTIILDRATRLALDKILIEFCRASAERVKQWCEEERKTNDIAYVYSLNGDNTRELITLVFETAIDRDNARRELAPVIDILADAGLRDTSSRLRHRLRHS